MSIIAQGAGLGIVAKLGIYINIYFFFDSQHASRNGLSLIRLICCMSEIKDHCKYADCNSNYTVCKNNPAKAAGYECLCMSCRCSAGIWSNGNCTLGRCQTCVIMVCQNNCIFLLYSPHHVGHEIVHVMHRNYTRMLSK